MNKIFSKAIVKYPSAIIAIFMAGWGFNTILKIFKESIVSDTKK
jgi:hypothetical protein